MAREMRRKDRLLSSEKTAEIFMKATHGVLGLVGDDNCPYTVPLSFAYRDGHIYFHSFKEGYKLDCIRRNPKVSFTVVTNDDVDGANFDTFFESAIAFGTAAIIEGKDMLESHMEIIRKYSAAYEKEGIECYYQEMDGMVMIDMEITSMTGKAQYK